MGTAAANETMGTTAANETMGTTAANETMGTTAANETTENEMPIVSGNQSTTIKRNHYPSNYRYKSTK